MIEGLTVYRSLAEVPVALDRVSSYLPPAVGLTVLPEVANKGCGELWLNPGAGTPQLTSAAQKLGLVVVNSCSIVDVGFSPGEFPD